MAAKTNDLVTKKYLDKKLKSFNVGLKTALGGFKDEIKTELRAELSEDLYKIKDEIVGEIKAYREESDTHQYSHVRINEELDDHEKRISALQAAA